MLANLLFVIGVLVFVLKISDIFLSEPQKRTLTSLTVRTWNILDEMRRTKPRDWLKRPVVRRVIFITLLSWIALAVVYYFYLQLQQSSDAFPRDGDLPARDFVNPSIIGWIEAIGFGLGISIGFYIAWKVITRVLVRQSWLHPVVAFALVLLITGVWVLFGSGHTYQRVFFIQSPVAFYALMFMMVLIGSFIEILILAWLLCVTPLVVSIIAMALLWPTEFIVRRIAEYPKGPLLALSGFCAAVAGFLKLF